MELSQLEYFKALASFRHFTRAAENVAVSQSALSRSIAKLEKELGCPLFDRSGKTLELTEAGETLLFYGARALREIEAGKQAVASLARPDRGTVSLCFLHSLGSYLVPMLLSQFRKIYSLVQFKLDQNNSSILIQHILSGEVDLCFSSMPHTSENLRWISLCTEELFIVVPRGHRLAKHKSLRLQEIAAEPLITFKQKYGLRLLADRFFQTAGIRPYITFEGDEIMTVACLVEANLGVAVIPHTPGLEHLNITFIAIQSPVCTRSIGIAWNPQKYLSPAAQNFRDFVLDAFKKPAAFPLAPYYKALEKEDPPE